MRGLGGLLICISWIRLAFKTPTSSLRGDADWLISGSFRSTALPIFWAGHSGDLFALPMRLAIAE